MLSSTSTTTNSLLNVNALITRNLWIFLSILSAILLILSFPNPGISILAWFSFVPFFIILMTESLKKVVLSALITGVIFNVVYLFWMKEYKHPASLSGGVFTEMIFFILAVLLSRFLYRNVKYMRAGAIVAGWLTVDYLKTIGFLAFPWGILGYTQYKNLFLIQTASVFGIWGITFLILYCNSAVSAVILDLVRGRSISRSSTIQLAIVIFLCVLSIVFGLVKLAEERREAYKTARIALVQANFDPWSPNLNKNLTTEINLTRKALKQNPDLVVWSESSVPFPFEFYLRKNNKHAKRVHNFIRGLGKPFLFGSIEFVGRYENDEFNGNFYNVAVYYNSGKLQSVYRKIHLVPFGEWFPYKRLFPWVVRILEKAGAGGFTPGRDFSLFDGDGFIFSVLICFEDVFGNFARKFVLNGSELLINVTNDAWTGSPKAEIQHYSKSIFRTIENRRSLVRATNGGVTACINPYGRLIEGLELFTTDYLVSDVPIVDSEIITFYTRFGDFFPRLILFAVAIIGLYLLLKKCIDRISNKNKM